MTSPYLGLPPNRFWKTGVASESPTSIKGLYKKRFDITHETRIATAGSCFAQHIARNLRQRGVGVLDVEPPPPGLSPADAQKFGYNLYSARYGNVYLSRQLLQILREAFGQKLSDEVLIWKSGDRYFDAMRPSVEPYGLSSPEEVRQHRDNHLAQVRSLIRNTDLFVFTFGLTEGWVHTPTGTAYPTAPGTLAGNFDQQIHAFKNFNFNEIFNDMCEVRRLLHHVNPNMRMLLTVSPVPLTATASDQHVLMATTYSKSVLRAVAGELYKNFDDVEYFPSFEIIATPIARGVFYEPNLRAVTDFGVEIVMRTFFSEHRDLEPIAPSTQSEATIAEKSEVGLEVQCEEALLEAFAQ